MIPVEFKNVTHYYGSIKVLNNISFSIEENLITVILGKSGSGKSTLLQIINGLIKPSSGEVFIFENKPDYDNLHSLRLKIGYAVQGTGLFPHMTIYENISLLARIEGMPEDVINARVEKLMKFVNLDASFKTKYPYLLSGGEQQRAGICRAMMLNPPLFLLDEAFGALDPVTKYEIHNELLNIRKQEPRTIIMVTHDLREAEKLADRAIVIENGEIQQYDTPENILRNPANEFVKNFVRIQK